MRGRLRARRRVGFFDEGRKLRLKYDAPDAMYVLCFGFGRRPVVWRRARGGQVGGHQEHAIFRTALSQPVSLSSRLVVETQFRTTIAPAVGPLRCRRPCRGQGWQNLPRSCRTVARTRPGKESSLCKAPPKLVKRWTESAETRNNCRNLPQLGRSWPSLAKLWPNRPGLATCRPAFGKHIFAKSCGCWPNSGRCWPTPAQI